MWLKVKLLCLNIQNKIFKKNFMQEKSLNAQ